MRIMQIRPKKVHTHRSLIFITGNITGAEYAGINDVTEQKPIGTDSR